jgi:hypothetical protein
MVISVLMVRTGGLTGALMGLVLACSFDASGEGAGEGGSGDEDDTSSADSEKSPPATGGASTTDGEDASDATSTTVSTTSDPTVDPASTGSSEVGTTTGEHDTSEGTTEAGHAWYTPCPCVDGMEQCINFYYMNTTDPFANMCYPLPCEHDHDCPPAPSGSANRVCIVLEGSLPNGGCRLDCTHDDTSCPEGMECIQFAAGHSACGWPIE